MADSARHTSRWRLQSGDGDNNTDARLSPTQPLSSSSSRVVEGYYGEDVSTASDTDDSAGIYQLNLSSRTVQVTWEAEGLARHIPSLKADLHVDTEQRTALITLRRQCILKSGPSSGVPLYLFIYPENIRSVEFAYTPSPTAPTISVKQGGGAQQAPMTGPPNRFIRLRFILIEPPTFVVPKNQPLEPKGASTALVDALQSLATVRELSTYLDMLSLVAEVREQLALLPSVFSRCRLVTNEKRASIARLYRGVGGEVVNPRTTALVQEAEQGSHTHHHHATTSGKLQDAAQISTPPQQTRKRPASASPSPSPSELLPPYPARKDEGVLPGPSRVLDQTEKKNASQSQESTQLFTPLGRDTKRPRLTATTPSDHASPPTLPPLRDTVEVGVDASSVDVDVDPQKLSFIIHQLLSRNAALEKRVQHLETSSTSRSCPQCHPDSHTHSHSSPSHHSPSHPHSSPSHHPHSQTSHQPPQNIQLETCPHQYCRYNTSEASSIRSSIRHRIDDALETGLDTACSKLEDWAHLEFQEQVRAEITGQLEDLGRELGREWKEDLRVDVKWELKDELKEVVEGLRGQVRGVKEETVNELLRRVGQVVVDTVGRSGWLGPSGSGASNSGHGHGPGAGPGAGPHGSGSGGAYPGLGAGSAAISTISGSNFTLPPNEQSLFAAIADIQNTFTTDLTEEEMARVMDHLEEHPLAAVKYNACGEGMRRFFVGRWKGGDTSARRRTGGGWRGGGGLR